MSPQCFVFLLSVISSKETMIAVFVIMLISSEEMFVGSGTSCKKINTLIDGQFLRCHCREKHRPLLFVNYINAYSCMHETDRSPVYIFVFN